MALFTMRSAAAESAVYLLGVGQSRTGNRVSFPSIASAWTFSAVRFGIHDARD